MNAIKKLILKAMASSLKVKLGSVLAVAVIGGGITTGVVYHNQNNASPQKQVSNVVKEKVTSEGNDKKETINTNTPNNSTENVDSSKEQTSTATNTAVDTAKTNNDTTSNDGSKNNSSSSNSNKSDKNASTATSASPSKNTNTSTSTNANANTNTNTNTNNSPTPSSTSNTASNTPTPAPKPSYNEADNITSSPYQPDGDKQRILDGVSKYNRITINGTPVSILNSVAGYLTCDFQRTVPVKNALTGKVLCGKYKITRLDFTATKEISMDMDLADRCIVGNELHTSLSTPTVSGSLVYSAYFAYITDPSGTVSLGRLMVELSPV